MRARKAAAGMRGAACGRNKSMRGRNNHNFQARSDSTLAAAAINGSTPGADVQASKLVWQDLTP